MKRILIFMFFILCLSSVTWAANDENLTFGLFGTVSIYRKTVQPSNVVLFLSGDDGWNKGVADMANQIADMDTLVVGVDVAHYLKEMARGKGKCGYPAADFEALSKFVQKSLDFPVYIPPLLIGYSSGGSLIYAMLAQSPPNTFEGGISLGFCPELKLTKSLCKGYGFQATAADENIYDFVPGGEVQSPWVVLQGQADDTCRLHTISDYVRSVKNAQWISLPGVGHGFSNPSSWMPQLRDAYRQLSERTIVAQRKVQSARPVEVKDLPLIEVLPALPQQDFLAVIVTGDGGWASIDRDIGTAFAEKGISVVGFNSLQYFWSRKTPEQSAADLNRVLLHYLALWKKKRAILVGYSLGADVLPFMASRLPAGTAHNVALIALLGPSRSADFEFHLTDWLGSISHKSDHPVLPEVQGLKDYKVACLFGDEETDSICKDVRGNKFVSIPLSGGHHFGGAFKSLADLILKQMNP